MSLAFRPVPFPIIGWIWIGGALSLVVLGLWLRVAQPSNPTFVILFFVGLALLPFNPRIHRRIPRKLEIDESTIQFLRGNSVIKSLPWNRVEKVQYGPVRWRRSRSTSLNGNGRPNAYISFVGSTDLESIRVDGFEYEVKRDEIESVIAAIAGLTRQHSIPVEEKEWIVFG